MKYISCLLLLFLYCLPCFAQDKPAYRIFNAEGREISYEKMLRQLSKAELVFFGELHDNSMAHWLELEITQDLSKQSPGLSLAFEMLEADDQLIVDEYLQGIIEERHLLNEAKLWDNYQTDYRPLVEFAKRNELPVIASNIPRRYANLVFRRGLGALDTLSEEARQWIAPLPLVVDLSLPGYQQMLQGMGGHGNGQGAERLVQAQAIKDATMAHFILKHKGEERLIHFNGAYHSRDQQGIIWYLQQVQPALNISTIETVEQADIRRLQEEHKNKADYIICIPANMTKTFHRP